MGVAHYTYTMIYLNDSNFYLNITVLICSQCEGICTVHDSQVRINHCAWLPRPACLAMHDSPDQKLDQNITLCMTPRASMPHCA